MKALRLVLCLINVALLSACSSNWQEAWRVQSMNDWAHNRYSPLENLIGPVPTAYSNQNGLRLLKPSGIELRNPAENVAERTHVWSNDVEYRTEELSMLAQPAPLPVYTPRLHVPETDDTPQFPMPRRLTHTSAPVEYNADVSVFPVDGDIAPYPLMNAEGIVTINHIRDEADRITKQVFFDYGSARVKASDKNDIRKLAQQLAETDRDFYKVNIVGHASKRVDHVNDPLKKKMINFAMAQKRADAVTRELQKVGMRPDLIVSSSRGDEVPNLNRGHKTQEAADRRVDISVDN